MYYKNKKYINITLFEVLKVVVFYVMEQCNLLGNTDVSEEATHFIFRLYEDASGMFL
jgi:hypothetical protein